MSDRDALELECELASMQNLDQALRVAQGCLKQAPEHDKKLWGEAVKLLQQRLMEKVSQC
jgi:hypothetical protein